MKKKKEKYVTEWCPHCTYEVKLKNKLKVQKCPKCGEKIIPCSICDMDKVECSECPLGHKGIRGMKR